MEKAILEFRRRRRRLRPFKSFPLESHGPCASIADQIVRERIRYLEHQRSREAGVPLHIERKSSRLLLGGSTGECRDRTVTRPAAVVEESGQALDLQLAGGHRMHDRDRFTEACAVNGGDDARLSW